MSKKFNISAIAERRFRVPVTALFAGEQLTDKGEMQVETTTFTAVFRALDEATVKANLKASDELRSKADVTSSDIVDEHVRLVAQYTVNIEQCTGHEFPFIDDNGLPDVMTPEKIRSILFVPEFRTAIESAYKNARDMDVLGKNLKK